MTIEQAIGIMGILSDAQEHLTRGDQIAANDAINRAKEALFLELYYSEFKTIDGVSQHPDGYNFAQWLEANNAFLSRAPRKSPPPSFDHKTK